MLSKAQWRLSVISTAWQESQTQCILSRRLGTAFFFSFFLSPKEVICSSQMCLPGISFSCNTHLSPITLRLLPPDPCFYSPFTDAWHNSCTVPLGSTQAYVAGIAGELKQTVFNSNASTDIRFHCSQISWSHSFSRASPRQQLPLPHHGYPHGIWNRYTKYHFVPQPTVLFVALVNAKQS